MQDAQRPFGAEPERTAERSPCPYGLGFAHDIEFTITERCDGATYRDALATGWRRSGNLFYRNICEGCDACVPIRVDAERLAPGKTQRHAIRMNGDLALSVSEASFMREDYDLFARYLGARHPEEAAGLDETAYIRAYVRSPVETVIVRYRTPEGKLVALGYLDALPDGLSSVYFAFDPDESKRSLGAYSVFAEAALARRLGLRWYYLGFWVKNCKKMAYKTNFRPYQLARDGEWKEASC
jgi:arginine-tRNA-protein transferase